jgi:hypothetical protein
MRKIMIMVEYLGTKISLKTEKELGERCNDLGYT